MYVFHNFKSKASQTTHLKKMVSDLNPTTQTKDCETKNKDNRNSTDGTNAFDTVQQFYNEEWHYFYVFFSFQCQDLDQDLDPDQDQDLDQYRELDQDQDQELDQELDLELELDQGFVFEQKTEFLCILFINFQC